MESVAHISFKGVHPVSKIYLMRTLRYLQAGYLLHLITVASIFLFFAFGKKFMFLLENGGSMGSLLLFGYLTLHAFTLPFFSQLDAHSRYQNYKMVKDKIFYYGFDKRILKPFVYSRCQRDAISVAAYEMQYGNEWKSLIYSLGFRWYHILPHMIVRNPLILLTKQYWNKTLFVKHYRSKYFLW